MASRLWFTVFFSSLLRLPFHCSGGTVPNDPVDYKNGSCLDATKTTTAGFQANLNLLLASLSSNAPASGYYNDTKGRSPDQVYGLALCRGDVTTAQCQECLANAVGNVTEQCPNGRRVIVWSSLCLLRYANESFFGKPTGFAFSMHNIYNVSDTKAFNVRLRGLVDNLTELAAASPRKFATWETDYEFSKMYGMAQCTRDLSPNDCKACLREEIQQIRSCCDRKQGGVLVGWSCLLRYELYIFYTDAGTDAAPPPTARTAAAPSPASISTGNASVPTAPTD